MLVPTIDVFVDGRPEIGTSPAMLVDGRVLAPLDPYGIGIAERIEWGEGGDSVVVIRGEKHIVVRIPQKSARARPTDADLRPHSIHARRLPSGEIVVEIARLAEALGERVLFEAHAHVLEISMLPLAPIATMTPFSAPLVPLSNGPIFPVYAPPTPRPSVNAIPDPRRTPLAVSPSFP
jgi:hypothetical protein